MALPTVNVSPSDVASGTYGNSNLGAGYSQSGTTWTAAGSGSQSVISGVTPTVAGFANHE